AVTGESADMHKKNQDSPFGDYYWNVSAVTIHPALDVDLDGKPDTDLRILVPDCEKDDSERYFANGTIVSNRGLVRCDEEEETEEEVGTWSYDESMRTIIMENYDTNNPVEAQIESASDSEIVLVSQHQSSIGTHTIRMILKRK